MNTKTVLTATAVVAGLFEVVQAPFLEMTVGKMMAAAFGLAFLGCARWLRRNTTGPGLVLGLLFALELAFLPMYDRASMADWALQVGFGALSVIGLGATFGVLVTRRRTAGSPG